MLSVPDVLKALSAAEAAVITPELHARPCRVPDLAGENAALVTLAQTLASSRARFAQALVEQVARLCRAESAAVGLLEQENEREVLRWTSAMGEFAPLAGQTIPPEEAPWPAALSISEPALVAHLHRHYSFFRALEPSVEEALLAPLIVNGTPVGTLWAFHHTVSGRFDAEDARALASLARFGAAAHAAARAINPVAAGQDETDRQFGRVLRHSEDYALFMLDRDGLVTEWTDGARKLLGYSESEVLGRHFSQFFTPEEVGAGVPQTELEQAAALGRAERESWRVHRNGRRIWVNAVLSPVRSASGSLLGYTKIARDLTERRRAEEEAEQLKSRLRAELTDMINLHEMSTRLLQTSDLSHVLAEILDATLALQRADFGHVQVYDSRDSRLTMVAQRGFSSEFLDRFARVGLEGGFAYSRAARLRQRVIIEDIETDRELAPDLDDSLRGLFRAVHATPIVGRDGTLLGVLSIHFRKARVPSERELRLTDLYITLAAEITARTQQEQELRIAQHAAERANRTKSRFLATASHDLRQPLQTLALLNGSLRRLAMDSAAAEAISQQEVAITTMSRLLSALLDISKLESGAIKPEPRDFAIAPLFEGLRKEFATAAASKGLRLHIEVDDEVAHGDPSLIEQIVRNLLSNAIKYTREGAVSLQCAAAPGHALGLRVCDTGIGIPAPQLEYIYDEFYQIGVPASSSREGYGLGLSIVQRLLSLLDLKLDVQSEVGKGSSFTLFVPAGEPTPAADPLPVEAREQPVTHVGSARVLLVEDDMSVRNATRMLLSVEGYQVTAAATLSEALQYALKGDPIDVLVTDYHLANGETGAQVIAAVREQRGANLKAVLVTGDTSATIKELPRDAHMRIASKPIKADELIALLEELTTA